MREYETSRLVRSPGLDAAALERLGKATVYVVGLGLLGGGADLDRNVAIELDVVALVDGAETARTRRPDDVVLADPLDHDPTSLARCAAGGLRLGADGIV